LLALAAVVGLSAGGLTNRASAQAYPAKPIRLVVPFPPAGATDILSRELARHLSDRLKQLVIVDNRPGAGGALGSDLVAKSAPDRSSDLGTVQFRASSPMTPPSGPN
jgi:tripartite-type tricarboxylate transporter receptor subunit TctC